MAHKIVPRLNDRDLIRAFEQVQKEFEDLGTSVEFKDFFGGSIAVDHMDEILKIAGNVVRQACLKIAEAEWRLSRTDGQNDSIEVYFQRQTIAQGGRPSDKLIFYKVEATLDRALRDPLAIGGSSAEYSAIASHGLVLEKMQGVAADLIENTDKHRNSLTKEHLENERLRQEYFDSSLSEARKGLEDERSRLEDEFSKRNALLDEREVSLNDLKKKLDDRNNTHVRREIRSTLLQLAKERLENFNLSGTTRKQYLMVNAASAAGFLLLAVASFYYGSKVSVDSATHKYTQEAIALIIKSGSYAAAAIALGSWYLGWLNRWLQRIADSEFKLQQFRLDIERASWLAETVLEWKSSSEEPFPELLAARLSAGLFQSSGADADGPKTPASHLAEALFGAATSAKVRLGENELNFDRKGVQRLGE